MEETWGLIRDARLALAGTLDSFDEEQWNTQSLCTDWKTRHVIGHLIGATEMTPGSFAKGFLANRGFNRYIAQDGIRRGSVHPKELLDTFRATAGNRHLPPGVKPPNMLLDITCHSEDIRRPLSLDHTYPPEVVKTLLPVATKLPGFLFGTRKRIAGLRLAATDVSWTHGSGPEVRGPGAALVLMMAGRPDAVRSLEGEGVATLRSRF
jgi:uncharacterized protein (TIGR03083 family)